MTIKEARTLLGKDENAISDEELQRDIDTARTLADIVIDKYLEMTPEERKKWHHDHPKKQTE